MELLAYTADGNIVQPENSNDGYKNYEDDNYARCSHNRDGSRDAIRLSFKKRCYVDSLFFYSRGGRFVLPDKLRFFATNQDGFDLSKTVSIGTIDAEIVTGSIQTGIVKFNLNTKSSYKYLLFDFQNTSQGSYWYWNEIEVVGFNSGQLLLLSSESGEIITVDDQGVKSIPSQTEQDFIDFGLDDLSPNDFKTKYKHKQYIQDQYQELGDGRIFSHTVNFDKYIINKIEIQ